LCDKVPGNLFLRGKYLVKISRLLKVSEIEEKTGKKQDI